MLRPAYFACLAFASVAAPALAAGDLLVAPTRIVIDGARGTEIILNNVGTQPATYRITLELRRMMPDGRLDEVPATTANERERATLAMISYAPRRVTLPPNQPQTIRIGARLPEGLADGEYRAHMLFRAIPDTQPAIAEGTTRPGLTIALTPIYGVTIPVIVRKGNLDASAVLSDVRIDRAGGKPSLAFRIARTGSRSVYGRIRLTRPGRAAPLYEARGIAVYAEIAAREVSLELPADVAAQAIGPVRLEYLEDNDAGGMIAETRSVLR